MLPHFLKCYPSLLANASKAQKRSYYAIFANLMSSSFISSGILFIKLSKSEGSEISFIVGICGILTSLVFIMKSAKSTEPDAKFPSEKLKSESLRSIKSFGAKDVICTLLLGAVFCGAYTHFYFYSLNYITMGDAFTVSLAIHFVCNIILESIVLKEMPHVLTLISGLLGLIGLVLICQPESLLQLQFDLKYTTGVGFGVLSGVSGTIYYCGLQKFKNVPGSITQLSYFVGPVLYCSYDMIKNHMQLSICASNLRLFALCGCFMYVFGGMASVQGSQLSLPSIATLLKLLTIILGYILQIIFLSETLSLFSTIGACLIFTSILLQSFLLIKIRK
ncbi:uncharacterized protein LOC134843871 [Symsagittifera roscoffensis]|uniref:uncharacterized protein LOC134843871 n=1 Tax=Symsagittifera roscoffensis TaxID=84072 RepID=UPI00307BC224